jgi:hypothetical protein
MHTQNELKGNEWVRNKLNQSNETLTQTLDKFPSSSQLKYLLYRSLEWDEENRCTMEELLEYLKSAESVGAKRIIYSSSFFFRKKKQYKNSNLKQR